MNLLNSSSTITNSNGTYTMTLGAVSTSTAGAKTLNLGNGGAGGFVTGNITNGAGTISVSKTGTGNFTISGNISQSGNVVASGGTLTLSGTNTYTGTTSPDNSTLTIRGKNALPSGSTISFDPSSGSAGQGGGRLDLFMNDAGIVNLGNQINVRTAQTSGGVTAQWTVNVGNNGGATMGSTLVLGKMNFASISDPRAGGYILNVTGANSYGLRIGDVDLAPNVGSTGGTGSGSFQPGQGFNPTTAPLTITGTVRQNAASVVSGTFTSQLVLWGSNAGNSISGSIMNPADFPGNANAKALNIVKGSTGTWTLSGSNTYTGTTTISGGTLSINSIANVSGGASAVGAPATVPNGTIAIGSTTTAGTLAYTGTGHTSDRVINLAGTTGGATLDQSGASGLLKFTSAFTATGAGIKTLTLQGSTAGTGEIAGAIVDNSGTNKTALTKSGSGTWTLSAANTYTGLTTVSGGVLRLDHLTALPGGITGGGGGSALTLNGGVVGLGNGDFTRGLGTGVTQVQFTGSSGFAAYTADRTVDLGGAAGTVTWGTGSFVPTASSLILGATDADKTLTMVNPISLVAANRTVEVNNGSDDTDAVLSGNITATTSAGGLTKTGAGTLDLNGTTQGYNSLTATGGTTNVNGTLGFAPVGSAVVSVSGAGTKLRFGSVSQTLSSLTIGAGSTVIFTSGVASGSLTGGGGSVKGAGLAASTVPEPGTLGLLLVGALGALGRRRRQG